MERTYAEVVSGKNYHEYQTVEEKDAVMIAIQNSRDHKVYTR